MLTVRPVKMCARHEMCVCPLGLNCMHGVLAALEGTARGFHAAVHYAMVRCCMQTNNQTGRAGCKESHHEVALFLICHCMQMPVSTRAPEASRHPRVLHAICLCLCPVICQERSACVCYMPFVYVCVLSSVFGCLPNAAESATETTRDAVRHANILGLFSGMPIMVLF